MERKNQAQEETDNHESLLSIAAGTQMNSHELMAWVHHNIPFRQLQVLCRDLQQRARNLPFNTVDRGVKTLRATCEYLTTQEDELELGAHHTGGRRARVSPAE